MIQHLVCPILFLQKIQILKMESSAMAGKLILTSAANMSIEDANEVDVDFSSFNSVKVYKPDTTDDVTNLIGSETSKVEESVQI